MCVHAYSLTVSATHICQCDRSPRSVHITDRTFIPRIYMGASPCCAVEMLAVAPTCRFHVNMPPGIAVRTARYYSVHVNADMRLNCQIILIDQCINVCMWAPAPVIPRRRLGCECVVYPVGPRSRQRDNVHCTAEHAPMPVN